MEESDRLIKIAHRLSDELGNLFNNFLENHAKENKIYAVLAEVLLNHLIFIILSCFKDKNEIIDITVNNLNEIRKVKDYNEFIEKFRKKEEKITIH